MRGIALNFFDLSTKHFTFTIHARPSAAQEEKPEGNSDVSRRSLPGPTGQYGDFWTYWDPAEGTTPLACEANTNVYLTVDFLRRAMIQKCRSALEPAEFSVVEGFRRRIFLTLRQWEEGDQVVALEPYFLRVNQRFGFLADFRFRPKPELRDAIRIQQLSLSLDKNGQSNRNYYADRYEKLREFVTRFHPRLFPLQGADVPVDVSNTLTELDSQMLDVRIYVVGSDRQSRSQFMGVKGGGPLRPAPHDTQLHFIYRPEDKPLSHDLFRAIRGDTFRTFEGMERMFELSLTSDSVTGSALSDFSAQEIERVANIVAEHAAGRAVVPVVITPFGRHDDPEENDAYWRLKHVFLSQRIPIQVVASDTIRNQNKLKWSTSSIALQVFAKAGGIPWKVRPRHERCLIVGIGQAHRETADGIDRFLAYSVLTDSSGVFEEVQVLGQGPDEEAYLSQFSASLRRILLAYQDRFDRFVIHATFSIRRVELDRIQDVLSALQTESHGQCQFASMKFNDRNRFFGYAIDHNSRVPYESTVVRLSRDEYLVWFEGLLYGKPGVKDRVGGPVHVRFNYPHRDLGAEAHRGYLQDAINLSGANWRGFNAKSLPVSVHYAQLIATYSKAFDDHRLPEVDINTLTPWFL